MIIEVSVAYNFQTRNNKIKLLMEYESVTQEILFGNVELAALMSVRKYDIIFQNGDCSRESNRQTLAFQNKFRYQNATSLWYGKVTSSNNADIGYSNLKRLVMFCTEIEQEDFTERC
jgi:hypothetical protein